MLFDVDLTSKDLILLVIGAVIGSVTSYIVGLLVAAQTDKSKLLIVEILDRGIIVEKEKYYPFSIIENDNNKTLDNCYVVPVRIWNKGKLEVRNSDISSSHPLKISIDSSARVLGNPQIISVDRSINFEIKEERQNYYIVNFECFNPGEWAEINFYITGNAMANVHTEGRILGSKAAFKIIDDGKVSLYERVSYFAGALIVTLSVSCVPFLIIGIVWLLLKYNIDQLFNNPDSMPDTLLWLLSLGFLGTLLMVFVWIIPFIKRSKAPNQYPIEDDFLPSPLQTLKIYWAVAITEKRYRISESLYSYGQVIEENKIIDL